MLSNIIMILLEFFIHFLNFFNGDKLFIARLLLCYETNLKVRSLIIVGKLVILNTDVSTPSFAEPDEKENKAKKVRIVNQFAIPVSCLS